MIQLAFVVATALSMAPADVRVITADGRASLRVIGSSESRVRTSAPTNTDHGVTTVTAPTGSERTDIIVPRTARLDIRAGSGNAVVQDVGAVWITKPSGTLQIRGVRDTVTLNMNSGEATIDDAGRVEATTSTANLEVSGVRGNVNVTSINGRTTIRCVAGSVIVTDTNGAIEVRGTSGDVAIDTTSGRALWSGAPKTNRTYRLKTLSGVITFAGHGPLRDAVITLSTHVGHITSNTALPERQIDSDGRLRRLGGRFGEATTRIILDAFEGNVEFNWSNKGDDDEDCSRASNGHRDDRRSHDPSRDHGQ